MLLALLLTPVAVLGNAPRDIKAATKTAFTSSQDPNVLAQAVAQVLLLDAESRRGAYRKATAQLYSDVEYASATNASAERLSHLMNLVGKVSHESERDPFAGLNAPLERVLMKESPPERAEYLTTLLEFQTADRNVELLDSFKREAWERRRQDFAETVKTRDELLHVNGSMECRVTVRLFDKNGKEAKGYFVWICPTDRSDDDDNFVRFTQPSTPTTKERMKGGWVYLKIRKTPNRTDPVLMQPKEHLKRSEETLEYTLEKG
jgi:hypothetical protein